MRALKNLGLAVAIAAGIGAGNPQEGNSANTGFIMNYTPNTLKVIKGPYEYRRYEHVGFDGTNYCVQEVQDTRDFGHTVFTAIDGLDGKCDGLVDAVVLNRDIWELSRVTPCEEGRVNNDYNVISECREGEALFTRLVETIKLSKNLWYQQRDKYDDNHFFFNQGF